MKSTLEKELLTTKLNNLQFTHEVYKKQIDKISRKIIQLKNTCEDSYENTERIFSVGDYVKIYKPWCKEKLSKEVFKVSQVIESQPILYKLKDYDGEEIIGDFYSKDITIA